MITAPNNCKTLPLIALLSFQLSAAASDASPVPTKVATLLETYCFSCHDADLQKGDVRLDHFDSLGLGARLELLNRVQEQLYVNEMPPPDKKQPTAAERRSLGSWVNAELKKHNASKLEDKLRYPSYGNYVDHDKLFSGDIQAAPSTPARRWLVSPQIFTERVLDVLRLEGRERDGKRRGLYGVNNPFLLPEHSGVPRLRQHRPRRRPPATDARQRRLDLHQTNPRRPRQSRRNCRRRIPQPPRPLGSTHHPPPPSKLSSPAAIHRTKKPSPQPSSPSSNSSCSASRPATS